MAAHNDMKWRYLRTPFELKYGDPIMATLALGMFIALFAFGEEILGYRDPAGMVRLGLVATFIFGIICGTRVGR